jgi:Leucine-rich repeat (LRR) protein
MGRKTTDPPSDAPAISRIAKANNGHATSTNIEQVDQLSITQRINDFMMSVGVQDNVNLQQAPIVNPGAVLMGPSTDEQEHDTHLDPSENESGGPIVAHLAVDEADVEAMLEERWAAKVAQEMEDLTRQVMNQTADVSVVNNNDIVVMADEVKNESNSPVHVKSNKWTMAILLLFIAGGVAVYLFLRNKKDKQVDGLEAMPQAPSDVPSFSPLTGDPLLEELRSWIAPSRKDFLQILDPASPQSLALAWLHNDPITLSPGRSTRTVLERYVLAVLYYSTSGPSWTFDYLSDKDVCTWNIGGSTINATDAVINFYRQIEINFNDRPLGGYCTEDGESIGTLALAENKLRGPLPWELVLLSNLEALDFGYNGLTGSIPTQIGELTNLEIIALLNNKLTGSIPMGMNGLTRLEVFLASENGFTGSLPIAFPPSTRDMDLGTNGLTGPLPATWGAAMPALERLSLSGNWLTGTLPSTFGGLSNLQELWIYSNLLTGTIPSQLSQLNSLRQVVIEGNLFTGSVEEGLCDLPALIHLSADCTEMNCTCCTECCYLNIFDCLSM